MKPMFSLLTLTLILSTPLSVFAQTKRACVPSDVTTIQLALNDMQIRNARISELMSESLHASPMTKSRDLWEAVALGKANVNECKTAFSTIDVAGCPLPAGKQAFADLENACSSASLLLHRIEMVQLLTNFSN